MPYIFALIAAASFATGYGICYQISKAQIQHMSDGIAAQNREAELQYVNLAEQANNTNKLLEANNAAAIKTITDLRDAFKPKRMYDTHRKSSSCANSNTTSTVNPATNDGELSAEYTDFLKSEAYRADEISAYAVLCSQFIKGIDHGR
jgi:predicted ATPase